MTSDIGADPGAPITRALISVSDKTALIDFARFLVDRRVELISTGGSARKLEEAGLPVTGIESFTGFPEILDGRVKTLHPRVHGGILARRDLAAHRETLEAYAIPPIDLVVANLYPFAATVASGADPETCIENIDIGGPTLIRGAAKNHSHVTVVVEPQDYRAVMEAMEQGDGRTSLSLRRRLAQTAFAHTAAYDATIAGWMAGQTGVAFPERFTLSGRRLLSLRYGENPHQDAALYASDRPRPGVSQAAQLQGKPLSYNNIADADAAFELAAEFERPAVVIVKHANPCGVAEADTIAEAYARALACDPVSAFGGIIALNRPLDGAAAAEMAKLFAEVLIAPGFADDARAVLADKKNLRVLVTNGLPTPDPDGVMLRTVAGGFLVQSPDDGRIDTSQWRVVTQRSPSAREMADLLFAFRVARHVKSNAIVYVRNGATVGIGAGQMSRVDSARLAAWKAEEAARSAGVGSLLADSVVASDAFFPFPDGLLVTAEAGAKAVVQPGGSVRDEAVIAAANERGLAMVFTGQRHFRH